MTFLKVLVGLAGIVSGDVLMERMAPPATWAKLGRAPAQHQLTVHAMLQHEADDVERLEETLMDVSDPRSPAYGAHLNLAQVNDMVPISADKLQRVKAFFQGCVSLRETPGQDILSVTLTAEHAERLFSTQLHTYTHASGASLLRASEYSVPADIATAVYVIGDLVSLPRLPVARTSPVLQGKGNWTNACPDLSGCGGLITPVVLKTRYNVPMGEMTTTAGNTMAIAEFQGQYFKHTDIKLFGDSCKFNCSVDLVIGGDKEQAGVESELDIEYIKGVSPGVPLTVVYAQEYSLLDWMTQINGREDAELVHSVSYGNDEAQQTGTPYMMSCNVQFMKAGVRGLSVLFASGDQGVCGREGCGLIHKRFHPDFPSASPYVTAVGGTDFATYNIGDETAWTGSGGGFSDTFAIPDWQADAVAAYKADPTAVLPDQSLWNNTGRGYPDVAALGGQKTPYCVVANGRAEGVAGTSASCPTVAAIFARLNAMRLDAGGAPLGFLNPFIYQNPQAFQDVKSGCNGSGDNCFRAITGWDPATGNGSPDFEALSKLI